MQRRESGASERSETTIAKVKADAQEQVAAAQEQVAATKIDRNRLKKSRDNARHYYGGQSTKLQEQIARLAECEALVSGLNDDLWRALERVEEAELLLAVQDNWMDSSKGPRIECMLRMYFGYCW